MALRDVTNETGGTWLWNQLVDALKGVNDIGAISTLVKLTPPVAPTVAVNAVAGNLTGNYKYAVAFVTGYWWGAVGSGTLLTQANTGGGTVSATVAPSGQQVNVSNLPIGPTGTVARIIYRTQTNGSSLFVLTQINDNTATSFSDNVADGSLGAAMPTTNNTGSWFQGKFVGTDSTSPFQWPVLSALPNPVGPNGTIVLVATGGVFTFYGSDGTTYHAIGSTPIATTSVVGGIKASADIAVAGDGTATVVTGGLSGVAPCDSNGAVLANDGRKLPSAIRYWANL